MFIDRSLYQMLLAPEERHVAGATYSWLETLCSSGTRVVGSLFLYKHPAPLELVSRLITMLA
jgi:hypothetical protein